MDADTSLKSGFYEQFVEHVFVSEVLQEVWFGFHKTVEVLRSEVDAFGYDLVLECNGVMRHIQMKTSRHDAKRQHQNVNVALEEKPCGCVVWLVREEVAESRRLKPSYLYFGGGPKEKLCLDGFKVGKHSKGDSTGLKKERPSIRLVPKSRYEKIPTTQLLVAKLFGLKRVSGK